MYVIMYLDLCETHWAFCDKVEYWSHVHIYITSDSGSDGRQIGNCYIDKVWISMLGFVSKIYDSEL